jgi:ABC-2 type transport system ATP-binding protein
MLLTTQYMEEADHLADTIVVVDRGKAIARGTADELKDSVGGERLEITVANAADLGTARETLAGLADGEPDVDTHTAHLTLPVRKGTAVLPDVVRELDAAGVKVSDLSVRRPSLDDVFLSLTGHAAEEPKPEETGAKKKGGRR